MTLVVLGVLATAAEVVGAVCRALSAAVGAFERSLRDDAIKTPDYVPDYLTREP
jgi:hypothetical protein